jgi:hypothetical protein
LALLKEVNMRRIICLLILISITLTGCANPTKEREEMIQKTFEDAKILNEKSSLENCEFLSLAPEGAYHSTSGRYSLEGEPIGWENEKDSCAYGDYNDGMYLIEIALYTSSHNVFGINVGDDITSVYDIMKKEGYKKGDSYLFSPVPPSKRDASSEEWQITPFSKNYITILFYIDHKERDNKITEIEITASDPKYAGIVY